MVHCVFIDFSCIFLLIHLVLSISGFNAISFLLITKIICDNINSNFPTLRISDDTTFLQKIKMSLIKVKDKFQVTIPAAIRKIAKLDVGDLLEITVKEDGIFLRRKTINYREDIIGELRDALAETVEEDNTIIKKSDDEIMDEAIKTIREVRAEKHQKKRNMK